MRCRSVPHLRRHLAATLDLTLWCLGCDVRHPDGNLLVRRGFARVRPPAGRAAATMYVAPHDGDAPAFAVWGFGVCCADPACSATLVLKRHDDAGARLAAPHALAAPVWSPDALPAARAVACPADAADAARLLATLARRLAAHEAWVAEHCAPGYRAACAAAQPRHVRRRQRLGTHELIGAWHAAADAYAGARAAAAPTSRAV